MEIYLIRHTTPEIAKGTCYGVTDLDLAETAKKEIALVLTQLPNSFDAVYSSPLKRCHQLARQITPIPIVDARLKEINFGEWELQAWDDIPKTEIQPWFDDWVNFPAKGGESYLDLYKRSNDFLNPILINGLKRIAIVTHAGVIRAINASINEIPLEKSFDLKLGYGDVIMIQYP